MMLLVIVVIAAIILGLGSQFIALRVRTKEVAKQRIVASRLIQEALEAVRVIAQEDWHNIDDKTPGTEYYPSITDNEWTLNSGVEEINFGTDLKPDIYKRRLIFYNVSRDSDGHIIEEGGTNDPSTRKVTAYAKHIRGKEISTDYYLTRWKNEIFCQDGWLGTPPPYDSKSDDIVITPEGWLIFQAP